MMNNINKIILFAITIFFVTVINAQELKIVSFEELPTDITARAHPRNDLNGTPCSLIKVRLASSDVTFKGLVVGDVGYSNSEYKVYVAEGTKRLTVLAPNYLPLDVVFSNYGITKTIGNTTYSLIINHSTPTNGQLGDSFEYFNRTNDDLISALAIHTANEELKEANQILMYIEKERELSSAEKTRFEKVKKQMESQLNIGKKKLLDNIRSNGGKLNQEGRKLLEDLLSICSNDYWLNMIKNKL